MWSAVGAEYEKKGNALLARKDKIGARTAYVQAKTYYSLARFPSPYWSGSAICPPDMGPIKAQSYQRYLDCYRRATELADNPPERVRVARGGKEATGYLRLPKGVSKSRKVRSSVTLCVVHSDHSYFVGPPIIS